MRRRSRPRIRASRSYRPRSTPRPTATPARGDIPEPAATPARSGQAGKAAAAGRTVRRPRPRPMAVAVATQAGMIRVVRRQGIAGLEAPDRRANPGCPGRSRRAMRRREARGPRRHPPIPRALCQDLRRPGPAAPHPDRATPSVMGPVWDHRAPGRRDRARRDRSRPDSCRERHPRPLRVPHPVRRADSVV